MPSSVDPNATPRPRAWILPATLATFAVAVELGGDAAREGLRYQRDAVLEGECWRLLTGNLAHLGPRHLALNLAGLALVFAFGGRMLDGRRGAIVASIAMAGVGLGLLAFSPQVAWYVGLSGALHGLFAARALEAAVDPGSRRWGAALLAALVLKLAWERAVGPLPYTALAAGGPVIAVAHLHGALAGAFAAAVMSAFDHRRSRTSSQV